MQVDRRKIEDALLKKGFVREDSHHRYFYHVFEGKRTGAYTYTSHGTSYKTYGDPLLKRMKQELRLDTLKETIDLLKCPMSGEDYNDRLRGKGTIPA